jgi:hypothetical protein
MKGTSSMNSRTSHVYQTGERVGHIDCTPVQGDVDGRYALHIGWNLSLIADFDELFQLAGDISAAVEAAETDRFNQSIAGWMEQRDADHIAVIDDDWVQDNIKNPGEQ